MTDITRYENMIIQDNIIHIPIDEAIKPKDNHLCLMNMFWTIYKDGHISIYTRGKKKKYGYYPSYTPQGNKSEIRAGMRGKYKTVFLECVYIDNAEIDYR